MIGALSLSKKTPTHPTDARIDIMIWKTVTIKIIEILQYIFEIRAFESYKCFQYFFDFKNKLPKGPVSKL